MDKKALDMAKRCVELAGKKGARQAEAFIENGRSLNASARDGAVENLEQSESFGLGLRVFCDGRLGFGYTSDFSLKNTPAFVEKVLAAAEVTAEDEFNDLPAKGDLEKRSPTPATFDENVVGLTPDWAIRTAIELEKVARSHNPRIKTISGIGAGTYLYYAAIVNSLGLVDTARSTYIWAWVGAVASDETGGSQVAYYQDVRCFKEDMKSIEDIAREAARRAVALLGASKIPSGNMPVVMNPEMTKSFTNGLMGAVNGDMVYKKASFLWDKLGGKIASDLVHISDEPLRRHGVSSSAFDGEGVPKRPLQIIDKGVLKLFLYDTYTAAKAKAQSTGSANRSYRSLPRIGTTNLLFEAGDTPPEKIIGEVKHGLYITSMLGRGINTVTGDYSRGARGFVIEDGELTKPFQEVTVAADLREMLQGIDAVGNDLDRRGSTWAPTIRFAELTVSGA